MSKNMIVGIITLCLCLPLSSPLVADEPGIAEALTGGKVNLSFRYRLESVDDDAVPDDGVASTLRTRVTYTSGSFNDFSVLLEADNLLEVGNDLYNSTRNGRTTRAVVADPEGTEINQAYLSYTGTPNTVFKFGRQRINRDNQRFIGGVGWRQNEQTYDSFTVANSSFDKLQLDYAYIFRVNRIFGPDSGAPTANFDSNVHALNARYNYGEGLKVSAYAYLMDFNNALAASNSTFGVRAMGKLKPNDLEVNYAFEYATQSDFADNPNDYSADYLLAEADVTIKKLKVKLGYEVLGGNETTSGEQFITPLATLHKFQGWADKFLATPTAGIEDFYVALSGPIAGTNATLVYHDFSAQDGNTSFGTEIDFSITKTFKKRYSALLKYASFNSDGFAADTDKFWFMFTAAFNQ